MENKSLLMTIAILIIALSSLAQETGTFTDPRDGKTYKTVKIGTQTWMAENLNFKTSDSWCYDDSISNCATYGRLYTWDVAKKACPVGWHLPETEEWTTLTDYLGGVDYAGVKLKEAGTVHWARPNAGARNSSGFSALPGGYRNYEDKFLWINNTGTWWSSNWYDVLKAGTFSLYNNLNSSKTGGNYKLSGFSVRCIADK